jgi:uncharacterized phage protein (TIGR02218 family)
MTFEAFEDSVEDGTIIELYQFTQGAVVSRFTNFNQDVVFNGSQWLATQISREDIERGIETGVNDLKIHMPLDNPIASQFIPNIPGKVIDVIIYRAHFTDPAEQVLVVFEGFIAQAAFDGGIEATLTLQPFTSQFKRNAPRYTYQSLCNNVLYDFECKIARGSFTHVGLVSGIDTTLRTITVNGVVGNGSDWAVGGFVAFPAGGNDDQRLVVAQSSDTLTLLSNFAETVLGSNVDVFAGCAHDITTCDVKFSNVINFGGFPYVPVKNPFGSTLRGGS